MLGPVVGTNRGEKSCATIFKRKHVPVPVPVPVPVEACVRSCETKELASWPKRMIMTGMLHPPAIAANIPTHINNRSLKMK